MAGIGGITTSIMHGLPEALAETVETWRVPGLDGYGAQTLGLGDAEFDLTTITYIDNDSDANDHIADCKALQGQVVYLVDDFGDTYYNVLIKKVDTNQAKRPMIWNGNANAVRVEVRWHCLTATPD